MSYFGRPLPITLILGSFFCIFLPLVLLTMIPNFVEALPYLLLAQVAGLGGTHFFITLVLYLQSANLDYFRSTIRNRVVYFGVPIAILVGLALYAALDLYSAFPIFSIYFFGAIRIFDFGHVGRQSFGMLQIFKRPAAKVLPTWSRGVENAFFVGMALLQWETFLLGGQFRAGELYATLPALAGAGLFVLAVVPYLRDLASSPGRRRSWLPLVYFGMQATAAALAVYDTRLYAVGLTLHYVEYHVIMAPRCFGAPLRSDRLVDRVWGAIRAYPVVVYAILLAASMLVFFNGLASPATPTATFFVHIFDGIFLVHYFIEAFLWKFHVPFYRDSLAPLYFEAEGRKAPVDRRVRSGGLGIAAVATAVAAVWMLGWLDAPARSFEESKIAPMHAENHESWGRSLWARGDLVGARDHLLEALERDPERSQARAMATEIERELGARPR
jgi:hypothetical protein